MANFNSQSTRFDPYISQLPIVEEMSKIGLEKQGKYDQGIQRIQTQIDNVAGMDVMKDVDKQYLQSKMGELGNNLKYVAAGDFSNYQLTNSVGGMVNQIGKDENIQNAVYSTQRIRNEQKVMSAAQKSGKSSPSNDAWFNNQVGGYLNDPSLGTTFSGKYEYAVDTTTPLTDAIKAAHADKLAEDEGVVTGYDKTTGKPIYNQDLIQHKVQEGLSTSKVTAIAREVYSRPDVARQMQIDAWYNYRGYTPQHLVADRVASTNYQKEQIFTQNPSLRTYATLATGDPQLKANKNLQDNYNELKYLDSSLADYSRLALSNPESAKTDSYVKNKLQEAGRNYAWHTDDSETKVSPQFTVNMDRSRLVLSGQEFQEKKRMDDASIRNINSQIGERENKMEIAQKKVTAIGQGNFTPQDPGVNSAQNVKLNSGSFYDKIKRNTDSRTSLFEEITSGLGVEYNGQVYNDLYKRDDVTGQMIMNPKYVGTILGKNLQDAATQQLKSKIDDTGNIHLNGDASKVYADKIKQWYDLGTIIDKQNSVAKNIEAQYTPEFIKIVNDSHLQDNYTVHTPGPGNMLGKLISGRGLVDMRTYNLSKQQMLDIVIYKQGQHMLKGDDAISKQSYQKLQAQFGDNTDNVIKSITDIGESPINISTTNAYNRISAIFHDQIKPEMVQQREKLFADVQRQGMTPELTLTSPDKKVRDNMNNIIQGELESIMKDKSSGDYKTAVGFVEKIKGDPYSQENNVIKIRKDDDTGDWYLRVANLKGSSFNENTPDIKLSPGTVQNLNLQSQLDPKEEIFKNSNIGKILDMNRGYSTTSSTTNNLHSDEAYNSALERTTVGNYTLGFQVQASDLGNTNYIPYLYIQDKTTHSIYKAIPLDRSKLANLSGLDSATKQGLLSQPIECKRTDLIPTIESLRETLSRLPNPDEAMKLLIGNIDKQ